MYLIQLLAVLGLARALPTGPFSYSTSTTNDGYAATTVAACPDKPDGMTKSWFPKLVPEVSGLNLIAGSPTLTMVVRGDQNYHLIDKANLGFSQIGNPLVGSSLTTLDSPRFVYSACGTNEPDLEPVILVSSKLADGTPCEYMYEINIDYTTLCNFEVDENYVREDGTEVIKVEGILTVHASLPQNLLGQDIEQDYERPISWKIELPKTLSVDTSIEVESTCTCDEDSDCGSGTCDGCECECPDCYQGVLCEQYTCAPTVSCDSIPILDACDINDNDIFQWNGVDMQQQLNAVTFRAITPAPQSDLHITATFVDNGVSDLIPLPTLTGTPITGGYSYSFDASTYNSYFNTLGTNIHKFIFTVKNTVSGHEGFCEVSFSVTDSCDPDLVCPNDIDWTQLQDVPPIPSLPTYYMAPSQVPAGFNLGASGYNAYFSEVPTGFATIADAVAFFFDGMSASDGLDSLVAISGSINPTPVDPLVSGIYNLTYCLNDIYGNGYDCCNQIIKVDNDDPEITCTDRVYPLNSNTEIDLTELYTASDSHSGIATQTEGTGTLVLDQDTSFVITVTDNAGNTHSTTCTAYWAVPSPSSTPQPSASPSASVIPPSASPSASVEPSTSPSPSAEDPYACPTGIQSQINFTLPYITSTGDNTFGKKYWLPSVNTDHTFIYGTTFTNDFVTLAGDGQFSAEIGNYDVPNWSPSRYFRVRTNDAAQMEVFLQTSWVYPDTENYANRFQIAWVLRDARGSLKVNNNVQVTVSSSDANIYETYSSSSGTFPKGYTRGRIDLNEFDNTVQTRELTVTLKKGSSVIATETVTVTLGAAPSVYPTYNPDVAVVSPDTSGNGPYLFAELPKYPVYPGQTFTVYFFYSTGKNPSGTQYNMNGGSFNLLSEKDAITFVDVNYDTSHSRWGDHRRTAYFTSNGNVQSANVGDQNVRTVPFKASSYYTQKSQTIGYYLPLCSIRFRANSGISAGTNSLNGISVQLTTDNMASESNAFSFGTNIPILFSDIVDTPYNDVGKVVIRTPSPMGVYPRLGGSRATTLLDTHRLTGDCTANKPVCDTRLYASQFYDCIREVKWDQYVGVTGCSGDSNHLTTTVSGSGSSAYCRIQADSLTGVDTTRVDITVGSFPSTWGGYVVYSPVSGSLVPSATRTTLRQFAYDNTWETGMVSVVGALTSGPNGQTYTDLDLTNLINFAVPSGLTYNNKFIVGVSNGPSTGEVTYTLSSAAAGVSLDFLVKSETTTIVKVTAFIFSSLSVTPTWNQWINEGQSRTASLTPRLAITRVGQESPVVVFAEHEDGQYSDVSEWATVTSLQPADIDMKKVNGVHHAFVPYGAMSLRCDIWLETCFKGVCGDGVLFTQLPHPVGHVITASNNVAPKDSAATHHPINAPTCTNLEIQMEYSDGSFQDFTFSSFTTLYTSASGYFVQDYSSKTQFCTNDDTALGDLEIFAHFPTMNEGASRADHLPAQSTTIKVYDVYRIDPQLDYHLPMKYSGGRPAVISSIPAPGTIRIVHCTPKYQMGKMKTIAHLTDGAPQLQVDVSVNTGYTEDTGGAATTTTVSGVHTYVQGDANGVVSFSAYFPRVEQLISRSGLTVTVDDSSPMHVTTVTLQYGGSSNTYTLSGTGRFGPGNPTTRNPTKLQYNFDDGSYLHPLSQFATTVPSGLTGSMPDLVDFQVDDDTRFLVSQYSGQLTLQTNSYVDNVVTVKAVCDAKITDPTKVKEGTALVDGNLYPANFDSKIGYSNLLTYRAGSTHINVPVTCNVGNNYMAACQVAISIDTRFIDWTTFLGYMGETGGTCGNRGTYCVSNPNGFGVNFVLGTDPTYVPTYYEGSTAQGEFIQIQVSDSTVSKSGNVQLCTLKLPLKSGVSGRYGLGGYVVQMRAATTLGGSTYAHDFQAAGSNPPMQPVVAGSAYVVIGNDVTLAPDVTATQLRRRMVQTQNPPPCGPFDGTGDTNGDGFVSLSDTSNIAVAAAKYASTAPNPILIYTGDIPVSCVDCFSTTLSPKFSYSSNMNLIGSSFRPLLQAFTPTLHHMNPYVGVSTTGQWLPDPASSYYNQDAMVPYDNQEYGFRNYSANNADYNFHVQAVGGVTRFLAINTPWDLINSLPTTCDNHVSLVAYLNMVVQTPANTLTAASCSVGDSVTFEIDIQYSNVDQSSIMGGVTITPAIDGYILVEGVCTAAGTFNASFDVITPSANYEYKVGVWVKTAISNTFSYFGVAGDLQGNTQLNPIFVGAMPADCTVSPSPSPASSPSPSASPSVAPSSSPVWCGNSDVQTEYGEECDPPAAGVCTNQCKCDTDNGYEFIAGTGCVDGTDPVLIDCPSDVTLEADGHAPAYSAYSINGVSATDNSAVTFTLSASQTGQSSYTALTTHTGNTFQFTMPLDDNSGMLQNVYSFKLTAQDTAGNSAPMCEWDVTIVDTTPPALSCGNSQNVDIRPNPGSSTSSAPVTFPNPIGSDLHDNNVGVVFEYTYQGSSRTASPGDIHYLAYDPNGNNVYSVTAVATDDATIPNLETRSVCFTIEVHEPFSSAQVEAILQRVNIFSPDEGENFYGRIRFLTGTSEPFGLVTSLPADLDDVLNPKETGDPTTPDNAVDELQHYVPLPVGDEFGCDNRNNFCFQEWTVLIHFGDCEPNDFNINIPYNVKVADCSSSYMNPTSCANLIVSQSIVSITFRGENFCQTQLAGPEIKAQLKPFTATEFGSLSLATDYVTVADMANYEATNTNFQPGATVVGLVTVASDEVLVERITLLRAEHQLCTDSTLATCDPATSIMSRTALDQNPTLGTLNGNAATESSEEHNFARFTYTEFTPALQDTNYVKLTATVAIEYLLAADQGSPVGQGRRRRALASFSWVPENRRALLQDGVQLAESQADANFGVSAATVPTMDASNPTVQTQGFTPFQGLEEATGVPGIVIFFLVIMLSACVCCGMAGCCFVATRKDKELDLMEKNAATEFSNSNVNVQMSNRTEKPTMIYLSPLADAREVA